MRLLRADGRPFSIFYNGEPLNSLFIFRNALRVHNDLHNNRDPRLLFSAKDGCVSGQQVNGKRVRRIVVPQRLCIQNCNQPHINHEKFPRAIYMFIVLRKLFTLHITIISALSSNSLNFLVILFTIDCWFYLGMFLLFTVSYCSILLCYFVIMTPLYRLCYTDLPVFTVLYHHCIVLALH